MSNEQQASPTGTPVLPQSVLRWLLLAYVGLGALDGAAAVMYGADNRWVKVGTLVLVTLAALTGAASPGLRKPPG